VVDEIPSAVCRYPTRPCAGVGAPGPITVLPSGGALAWGFSAPGRWRGGRRCTPLVGGTHPARSSTTQREHVLVQPPPGTTSMLQVLPSGGAPARPSTRAALRCGVSCTCACVGLWSRGLAAGLPAAGCVTLDVLLRIHARCVRFGRGCAGGGAACPRVPSPT
jgi:hypothetical protein